MADSPSAILLLRLQSVGSNVNLWGGYINTALQTLERAAKGYQALAVVGDATISWTNYSASNDGAVGFFKLTGSLSSAATLTAPGYQNVQDVWNATGAAVTIKCSGGTGVTIPNGMRTRIYCDATDYYSAASNWLNTPATTLTNAGDVVVKTTLETAIANASGLTAPFILNSAADTTPGYLSTKVTTQVATLTTTQVAGLTSFSIATVHGGGNEQLAFGAGAGYVGGFLNGGLQSSEFTPVAGTAYDVDCSSAGVTVNLGGMTTPQLGHEIKINKFGVFTMLLKGTVNGLTNATISATSNEEYRYSGSTWGWN